MGMSLCVPLMGWRGRINVCTVALLIKSMWSFIATEIQLPAHDHPHKNGHLVSEHQHYSELREERRISLYTSLTVCLSHFIAAKLSQVKSSRKTQTFGTVMQDVSPHQQDAKQKTQLERKVQTRGISLFTPNASNKGQTSPTCRNLKR